jgi:hypothetical protein
MGGPRLSIHRFAAPAGDGLVLKLGCNTGRQSRKATAAPRTHPRVNLGREPQSREPFDGVTDVARRVDDAPRSMRA